MSIEANDSSISAAPLVKTLLLTDLVDSTGLVEKLGDQKAYKIGALHDRLARDLLVRLGGQEVDKTDGFLLLFDRPVDAVGYALAYHKALAELSQGMGVELMARAGIHLGEILLRRTPSGDVARGAKPFEVEGLAKPTAARVMALAQGQQTLLTRGAYDLARRAWTSEEARVRWMSHGFFLFQGVTEEFEIFEVGRVGSAPLTPPPGTEKGRRIRPPAAGAAVAPQARLATDVAPQARLATDVAPEARLATAVPPAREGGRRREVRRTPRGPLRNPFYHRQGITDPRHFFGRADTVRRLFEMIASGQSCAVVGERRIGKSSLLAYLAHPQVQTAHGLDPRQVLAPVLDFLALHASSPAELWTEILEALELVAPDPETEELLAAAAARDEVTFAVLRRTLRRLKRNALRVVLLCDEFELAVQNPQFDQGFFGALRSLAGNEGVVFVTSSRFNLLELEEYQSEELRRKVLGSPFFNIFAEFRLGPFDDHELADLVAVSLDATSTRFEAEDAEWLDRVAGRHPYFLQLAAYHLFEALERLRRSSSTDLLALVPHEEAREELRRESVKIFRNQWHHSKQAERGTLASLALASRDGKLPRASGGAAAQTLTRLERRGLVRRSAPPHVSTPPDGPSLRHYRLFSELLAEWIVTEATIETPQGSGEHRLRPIPRVAEWAAQAAPERFSIVEEIGRGGTGTVYKAWDEQLERIVALKVLDADLRASKDNLERLISEARACARLRHPHIVVIHDIDVERGHLVQEHMAGGSLRDLLNEVPSLSAADLLRLAEQLAQALGAAHGAGVIHRDLKPENVLLSARPPIHAGERAALLPLVKLGDFGAALRLDDLGHSGERRSIAGTLAYMAPEQMIGERVGPASDFFALGMILYESRHGRRPPPAQAEAAARAAATSEGSEDETVLDAVVARCLVTDPRDRYRDAGEMLVALGTDAI